MSAFFFFKGLKKIVSVGDRGLLVTVLVPCVIHSAIQDHSDINSNDSVIINASIDKGRYYQLMA